MEWAVNQILAIWRQNMYKAWPSPWVNELMRRARMCQYSCTVKYRNGIIYYFRNPLLCLMPRSWNKWIEYCHYNWIWIILDHTPNSWGKTRWIDSHAENTEVARRAGISYIFRHKLIWFKIASNKMIGSSWWYVGNKTKYGYSSIPLK